MTATTLHLAPPAAFNTEAHGPLRNWPDLRLHDGFEGLTDRTPDAPAVVTDHGVVSYGALDHAANALAHAMLARGVRADEPVGVLTERSADLPLAFLAILKAGAVYVPMVADLPAQRLANMAGQAGIRLLVALDGLEPPPELRKALSANGVTGDATESRTGGAILRPERLSAAFRDSRAHRPNRPGSPRDRAAILFTSGSTGQPKGVQIQHDSCVNLARGHAEAQGITPDDRILLSTSPGFILGFRELCLPLMSGAAYVPASRALIDDPPRLIAHMERHGVTTALFTPSYLRLLKGRVPAGLRRILTAGERPNADDARHYARHLDYWNMHGATEGCGTLCMHRVDPDGTGPLPSGRPFTNTAIFLLDKAGDDVPRGETGEIHVVGVGVSRGYLGQPELTAHHFVETRHGRAYRTGDLGRWNERGELEALGRADDVVKVSGQSVSLGEIERTLTRHPMLSRAAAFQHRGRLIAVVESATGDQAGAEAGAVDWRAHLGGLLPAYMVPAEVRVVARMPISSAGKIDRKSLIEIADAAFAAERASTGGIPPQGPLETAIAAAWEEVLDVRPIRRDDHFFAIGGTSLLAIAIGQKLQALGHPVTVPAILASLTVEALARRIAEDAVESADDSGGNANEDWATENWATAGQEDFWVAARLGLAAAGTHITRVLSVRGPVPPLERWRASWAALLAHHAALRTGFDAHEAGGLRWRTVAANALPARAALSRDRCHTAEEARALIAGYATTPFDLREPPLARAGLLEIETGGETLVWFTLHHAVVDGLSARMVQDDLFAHLLGRDLPAAPSGVALASRAEQRYLASNRAERDRAYWAGKLDALADARGSALEPLPTDLPRRDTPTGRGAPPLTERLSPAVVATLSDLAKARGIGLHALLLALLAAEARRRAGRADVIIGSGVSVRPAGAEMAVGHFVNLLPVILPGSPGAFGEQIATAQSALTEAMEHADLPASRLIRDFRHRRPDARPASSPGLFEVALTANPSRFSQDAESGLTLAPRALPGALAHPAAGLDLAFSHEPIAESEGGGLELALLWNADVYTEATARAWLAGFAGWARWLAEDPRRLDAPLPALLPEEAERLSRWEHGEAIPRPALRGHELFEDIADCQPRRPAVVSADGTLSYAQLDARANRIAHALLVHGLTREEPVAVLTDCSADLPAALLGLWKAGGAHLPLAADLPPDRMAYMVRDADARLLLALDGLAVPAVVESAVAVVLRPERLDTPTTRPGLPGDPADLAYVIYTSGTTGQPKGVAVRHDGLLNAALMTGATVGLEPADRIALAATPGFDASLWELSLGLMHGMAIVPVSRALRDDPWALKAHYRDHGVTVAFHAPSYLRIGRDAPFEGLRILLTGGEAPNRDDARDYANRVAFWNAYGPTEASILVSIGRILDEPGASGPLPAGRPLPNARITLRRPDGTPVPPGVTGELWLGGAGLARGYLNQPELTAQAFVETAEGRFYRTGDLGRWREDGQLLLSGRIDHQVKLHGQRVELDEIEQALRAHTAVAEAVVLVETAAAGTKALRAFVRPAADAVPPDDEGWRAFLSDRLPVYMVPASVTPVPVIPLTAAGKIDRAALLGAVHSHTGHETAQPPRGPLETRIAALWSDAFGGAIARDDNFFALGGNSLLAVTLAHRLSRELGATIPARALFAAPTLAGFARKVAELQGAADATPAALSLAAPTLDGTLATEGEREFWVAEAAGLDTRPFTIPVIRRIVEPSPDAARWDDAWAALVARHDALRTSFAEDADGLLRRRVADSVNAGLERATATDRDAALTHIRARQGAPFAMSTAPLWRAGLVAIDATGETLFWLALHHSVGDGRSVGVLLEELTALLADATLPPAAGDMAALSIREQAYLSGPDSATDARFWRERLAAVPDAAFDEWPLDAARSATAEPGSHRFQIRLDADTAAALKALARRGEASLHALLLTLLARELRRRTGRAELLLGTTAAMRETAEEARVVGYGVTMLPLALRPTAGAFADDLRATQRELAGALEHARYPFAHIYHDLWSERPRHHYPARYPLFDIAVTENPDTRSSDAPARLAALTDPGDGLSYERTGASPGQDMVLIHEGLADGGLLLQWHVNAALYAKDTAEAWLASLAGWARWLAADPTHADSAPPALLPEESERLAAWEHGPAAARPALRFHELFERRLDEPGQSERPAVLTPDATVTYAALEAEANAIAHALIARGVERGTVVGVLTGRSPNLPAAALGVWKAGAVYLPLAADLPPERLAFLVKDAGAAHLLALDGVAVPDALAETPTPALRPEDLSADFRRDHAHRPAIAGAPDDTAYILYTSGSTGRPKGTLIGHAGYVNLLLGAGEIYGLTPDDRTLMMASPSFDVSLSDLGLPLAFGAALCPVPYELLSAPGRFRAFLSDLKVTVADVTPTYLRLFDGAELPTLRVLVTGGEAPFAADVRAYAGRLRYYNAYGPTENTITSSMGLLSPTDRGYLTAGRPLPNTSLHVRDGEGNPVPPGVVGEVWLGGTGLAKGYLNRPDLTAAAFVATARGRRYRTGDLGRWRSDGELEILGRIDDQVKLNGIRIELGEIEHALGGHPDVAQAVALIEGEAGQRQGLWAFVRPADGREAPSEDSWRPWLAERLPPYMIPAAVIPVTTIPLSKSGKIDRAVLRDLLAGRAATSGFEAPRGEPEETVAHVWEEVLRRSPIGREDNFFALGGHSLLAIAVAHKLEATLGHPIPARELFAEPTLAGFARRVAQHVARPRGTAPAAASDAVSDRATEGQREFWVAEQAGLDTRGFNIPLTLAIEGEAPEPERWRAAWGALIARHDALRTAFTEDTDGTLRRVTVPVSADLFALEESPDREAALSRIRERQTAPFAMAEAPLWRAGLIHVGAGEDRLLWLTLHHAVGDGLSLGILVEELSALLRGEALPPAPVAFDRTAAAEESYLSGETARADAEHWRTLLNGLDPAAFDEWPLDGARPAARTGAAAKGSHCHRLSLPAATAEGLRALARRGGTSLHAVMLALMGLEVRRRIGRTEFLLGTAASTRESAGEAPVVGYFVNMLPLPCRVAADAPVEQAVREAGRALAEGLRHARYPFARIYQDFRREHPRALDPARYPLFDFAVTENPGGAAPSTAGWRFAAPTPLEDGEVRYELRHGAPAQDMVLVHEGRPDGGIDLLCYANAALYERATARAWTEALAGWARHFADPARRPESPPPALLPAEERTLAAWEHGPDLIVPAATVQERFRRLAAEQPDRPALITDAETLGYAALNARANALAHALRARGARRGDVVGVLTERSPALPETALAVWKSGAGYLPLTADLPGDRLAFMATDADIRVLVALDGLEPPPALAALDIPLLRPESLDDARRAATAHDVELRTDPGDLAYVIYTSGSTGTPKGVMLHHRGLMNLATAAAAIIEVKADDRTLLMSSPSFDAWISDLTMTWVTGGAVVPVRRAAMNDIPGMRALFERLGVTIATLPPSYLRLFERADFPTLRALMTVGEPPNTADALHYAAWLRYYNGYGPTENTAAAAIGQVPAGATRLTAGRPLANTSVHILDGAGRPVPPGAVGEVWLGGTGLAIGYLKRPDLTAAAFVETPRGRRYRSGDLGRWTADGELLILGRADGQVKLRGQRVELGEIEHRLESHPAARQAVALVETAADGAQTLWGFVSLQEGATEPAQAAWHAYLAETLPPYMIPAAIVAVPAIPVTVAGKVDRAALLRARAEAMADAGQDSSSPFATAIPRTPPRGPVETRVAEIWADALALASVGREDSFFELGGDSLRAIAVVNRLRREFACKINDLYEHPVLADFAARCRPQPGHIQGLIRSVRADWDAYQRALPAYDAERDAALAAQQADYDARNRAYDGLDLTARRDYGHVLLTGATGYLGAYLLRELLRDDPGRRVTALVRGADDAAARQRLGRVLTGYFGAEAGADLAADPRLSVLGGDLRADGLGLADRARSALLGTTRAVVHCAANVNHFGHYRDFHADNVMATRRLLDLAAGRRGDPADFHFVSTLSVVTRSPETGFRLVTEYNAAPADLDENYYVRSKQEAERLVAAARGDLANACIHRVGNVVFAAENGPLQLNLTENAFFRQLAAFVRLGVVPDDAHVWLCHVDRVARAITRLASGAALANMTHHVENDRRDTLADFVTSAEGMADAVYRVGFDGLLDRLRRAIDEPEMDGALAQTLEAFGIYRGMAPQARARRMELTSARTQALLGRLGFGWPEIPRAGQAAMLRAASALFS